MLLLGVLAGLLGGATAAASPATYGYDAVAYTYDAVAYTYDASANLSIANATSDEARRSPAAPGAVSWGRSAFVRDDVGAANTGSGLPSVIYREGTPRPGNLVPRGVDDGALSFRDSLSNPIGSSDRPVFRPGQPYIGMDPSRLPPGSVVVDNVPPGHVSVTGVSVEEFLAALVERGRFPK